MAAMILVHMMLTHIQFTHSLISDHIPDCPFQDTSGVHIKSRRPLLHSLLALYKPRKKKCTNCRDCSTALAVPCARRVDVCGGYASRGWIADRD
uniref:Putative secreted protein n=1 Tax=Anopheles marajoara TaxID=58244 RepID=A0A2M4C9F8_9DIPT